MIFFKVFVSLAVIFLFLTAQSNAQLSGSINVGSGQTYTTLTAAGGFFAAVNSQGLSGNVTVNITSNLTENGTNALNQWTEFGAGGYTITISPSAAAERLISGNAANALIRLNGADRVTFDGRFSGSGMYLRFRNTNASYTTFTFLNDAANNTLTYCYIEGGNTNTTVTSRIGTILFSTTTGAQGNDNNTISYCDIRDRSDAASFPAYAIYSYGTTSTAARYNSGNQIINNNIYNFWKTGDFCGAVYLTTGTGNDWDISSNSIYQTSTRATTTNSSGGWNVIFLNYTGINNCTVSGNYIGGSAPNCSGTPWTSSATGNGVLQLSCLRAFSGSTIASGFQGNTIANINHSTRVSTGALPFTGVLVQTGIVNVGDVSGNTIGSATGTGNITINYINFGFYTVYTRGIDHRSAGDVENNTIGSITISSSNNNTIIFDGISYASSPSSGVSISNNLIGSSSTANSIQHTASTNTVYIRGIISTVNGANITLNNNIVANLTNSSTGSSSVNYAVINTGNGAATITGNTIHDLNSPLTNTSYIGTLGIGNTSTSASQLIQGNMIYGLNNTTTASVNTSVVGMSIEGSTGTGNIARNRIYGLTNASTGSTPLIFGLNAYWGSWTASNNQIAITNGELVDNNRRIDFNSTDNTNSKPNTNTVYNTKRITKDTEHRQSTDDLNPEENEIQIKNVKSTETITDATNSVQIMGIYDVSGSTWNYYYNTIYIGGSIASGNENSYCYVRRSYTTTVTFRNNLFYNARTGGTGYHYALGNEIGGSTGWSSTASNYNVFVSSNSNTIGAWGSGVNRTIDQWRTSSGGDRQSYGITSADISASNLFSSILNGNFNINSGNYEAWLVSGKGIALSGQNTDYEGNTRATTIAGGTTDIGADEFSSTPPSNPAATIDNAPGSGVTSNFTLFGRRICTINWGTGGSSYPTSMNVRYYSGVNPPGTVGGNYSNSYWLINIGSGSFSGATYNITIYFGDNETYTITSPSINTLLAKSNGTWIVYPAGSGALQTQLSWANLTARTDGLSDFSDFALTDATAPLPVILSYFGASVGERNVNLKWITEIEINNSGFDIERKNITKENNSAWEKIAFVEGKGNTNEPTTYKFNDSRLSTGKYQYRLKQKDYNGNFEYFLLTNPSEVIIGAPESVELSQNYPNPSNPKSLIDYQLSFTGKVILKVYDMTGRETATLVDEIKDAGYYTAEFDGSKLASGVYIYRLIIEGNGQKFVKSLKMALIK